MTATYAPGLHADIAETVYHSLPGLSSTGIKTMLDSPARYQWSLTHRTEKTTFDVGHAAHAKILGVGLGVIAYPDEHLTPSGNVSTKAATTAWASEQRAAGLVPVAPAQIAAVDAMAEAVLAHDEARPLLENGTPEVSPIWHDPDTGVLCRGRIDYLHDGPTAVDLKTCRDANPRKFDRVASAYGYAEQAVHYTNGITATRGDTDVKFLHVLVESAAPHMVSVVELDPMFLMIAADRVRQAIDLYAECQRTGEWPGYSGITPVGAPGWYGADDEDEMEIA
ncbi:hypothetical protein GCM10025865_00890 [Paraoerskovia sediminicola]|uniref:Putative exodeoxyribonuclease 8 PDDEXK-like domain-containing protein n=1 Tax=Paraoerskovia sediminicola TaxID=1138587 RepID=A0ABN6X7M2_9CELL|nr:PD-(D/E)XK nuclease-like domain-containing protein [Paraoerskovia sediminicola]BDZ40790.1 hypothetical protein GCM10025865_00890 [Paraoerskovia sediminicola]